MSILNNPSLVRKPETNADWQTWLKNLEAALRTVPTYKVATVPPATLPGQVIFVSNESGGAVLAFSDGTNWRRVTDRLIIS